MDKKNLVIGVDVGGSHVTAGWVDLCSKQVLKETIIRAPVNSHAAADEILSVWAATIHQVRELMGVCSIRAGFAMPGPFDYQKGICLIEGFDKYEALYHIDIRDELARRLQVNGSDILFRNDAEAFLDGEIFCGAAAGYRHAIGITLGTGLGSAYSHHGITADAALSVTLYRAAIIEEAVSTRGLLQRYLELTGRRLRDAKEIADRYDSDSNAQKAYEIFSDDLSWFLEFFIEKEQPEILVIGGNIAGSWPLFMPQVIRRLSQKFITLPEIKRAQLGEHAALIGGACCFLTPMPAGTL